MVHNVMKLNNLNLNSFIVFQTVYRHRNMTGAAKELALTQPGVSQHIQNLESDIGLKLFVREHRKIIPTKAAVELYNRTVDFTQNLETSLLDLTGDKGFLSAQVVIGTPIEFGNNILMPLLAKLQRTYPDIKFHIRFGLAKEMNDLIDKGLIDFAFVDEYSNIIGLNYEAVYEEELQLCCSKKYFQESLHQDKIYFESQSYAAYFEDFAILKKWFFTAMGYKKIQLKSNLRTEDAQGVFAYINQGMGIGIVPKHMLENNNSSEDLYIYKPKYKKVTNQISLAYMEKRIQGPFLNFIYQYLMSEFV